MIWILSGFFGFVGLLGFATAIAVGEWVARACRVSNAEAGPTLLVNFVFGPLGALWGIGMSFWLLSALKDEIGYWGSGFLVLLLTISGIVAAGYVIFQIKGERL